jgi:hypothetical protein
LTVNRSWFVLSSKVKLALVLALTGDLATLALGVSGGLPWVGVLASCITSMVPVVGAWYVPETTFPPLAEGSVAVPVASLRVPAGATVTMPEPPPAP